MKLSLGGEYQKSVHNESKSRGQLVRSSGNRAGAELCLGRQGYCTVTWDEGWQALSASLPDDRQEFLCCAASHLQAFFFFSS